MRGQNRTCFRAAAAVLALALLAGVMFSAFFIAAGAHHDCHGEHCEICACIALCRAVLRADGLTRSRGIMTGVAVLIASVCSLPALPCVWDTPVARKVRLND